MPHRRRRVKQIGEKMETMDENALTWMKLTKKVGTKLDKLEQNFNRGQRRMGGREIKKSCHILQSQ